jgi:hypothetical protein
MFCVAALWLGTTAQATDQLPIHIVYVNHVEVESVIEYQGPLVPGQVYTATPGRYAFTRGQLDWEVAQAEAVGARLSFHMSGAYGEWALATGDQPVWLQRLANGHTVGVHFHTFVRGPGPFTWQYLPSPNQQQITQAWQDHYDLVAALTGAPQLWIGESHYGCPSCWQALGYRLAATEQMALLPGGQHIVWLVERNALNVITYPHLPQIGAAGWHGPQGGQIYFDLRVPQLKKELLLLYMEWLERERLDLPAQMWCWGWNNHGGQNTVWYAAQIQELLTWLGAGFAGRVSPRGNVIARFAGDHEVSDLYEDYETWGEPLPSPLTHVNDQCPYAAYALTDAGVIADLTGELGLSGIRLFEMRRQPPENPPPGPPRRVFLLFREIDGVEVLDLSGVLAAHGVTTPSLMSFDVSDGTHAPMPATSLFLGSEPLVLDVPTPGDLNCDGVVDFDDINPFVLALSDPTGYYAAYPLCNWLNGDCNGDGLVDFDDINPFVALLSGYGDLRK